MLLAPVTLLVGSLALLIGPFALFVASFIKGSDESLDFSLKQTLREILYIPVASDLKFKAKPFIDMFISRVAKVTAALILLAFALIQNKEVDYLTPVFDAGTGQEPELDRHRVSDPLGGVQPENRPGICRGHHREHQAQVGAG